MITRSLVVMQIAAFASAAQPPVAQPAASSPDHRDTVSWAVFDRYRDANAALKPDRARVVFLGDSITENWAKEPLFAENPHYVGRGVSGQTALQMLVRFRADVIALKPRVVHIMAGTNDLAENTGHETDEAIEGAIQSMVELAQANHIRVVLASIPPTNDFPWRPGLYPAPRIQRINAWIESYAKRAGVVYVDYVSALATADGGMKPGFAADGVHPNSAAYEAMQPFTQAAIKSALRR